MSRLIYPHYLDIGVHFTQIPTFRFPIMAPEKLVFRKLDNCDFEICFSFYFHVKELARSWSTVQKSSKSVHGARRTVQNKFFNDTITTFFIVLLFCAKKRRTRRMLTFSHCYISKLVFDRSPSSVNRFWWFLERWLATRELFHVKAKAFPETKKTAFHFQKNW